jgi:hypothetical protein
MGRHKSETTALKKSDKAQIDEELGDFHPKDSTAVQEFMAAMGKPRHKLIVVICTQIAELETLPPLSRVQKKSKELLQKWIHDNWARVEPHLSEFTVYARDGTLLSKTMEEKE